MPRVLLDEQDEEPVVVCRCPSILLVVLAGARLRPQFTVLSSDWQCEFGELAACAWPLS